MKMKDMKTMGDEKIWLLSNYSSIQPPKLNFNWLIAVVITIVGSVGGGWKYVM